MMKIKIPDHIKGLIFDLDGTLVDSMPVHKVAWREICATKGFEFTDEIFYKYAGVPSEKIFELINQEYGTDFNPPFHSQLKEEAYEKNISEVTPISIVLEVVENSYGKMPMAIGTGSPRNHSIKVLEQLELMKYFDTIVSKDDVIQHKPEPDTFLLCAGNMGVRPEDCLVFEDGDPGIKAAKAAGMAFIDIRDYL